MRKFDPWPVFFKREWNRNWPFLVGFAVTGTIITKMSLGLTEEDAKHSKFAQRHNNHHWKWIPLISILNLLVFDNDENDLTLVAIWLMFLCTNQLSGLIGALANEWLRCVEKARHQYDESLSLSSACEAVLEIGNAGNLYMNERAPWSLFKEEDVASEAAAKFIHLPSCYSYKPNRKVLFIESKPEVKSESRSSS
ncbi:hypothetical protein ACFE04_018185 [Oxalis oulophora]